MDNIWFRERKNVECDVAGYIDDNEIVIYLKVSYTLFIQIIYQICKIRNF